MLPALPLLWLRRCVTSYPYLQEMQNVQELSDVTSWKAHQLTDDRKGTWSLNVTRNWRMTFKVDQTEGEIVDLDYEDYH